MPTVLCYGDSNTWGAAPMKDRDSIMRFGPAERWPGVLRATLGKGWTVIEEGLPGRTTVFDDPVEGEHKNGRRHLLACLESHWPLDLFVLMLGTNDTKSRFGLTPDDIAEGAAALLALVKASVPPWCKAPRLLLVCPPVIKSVGWLGPIFAGGGERSRRLAPLYRSVAQRTGASFFDAGPVVTSCDEDGVHFGLEGHHALGVGLAAEIKNLLAG